MVTIGIDARAAAEVPAGGGRYVRELLRALAGLPDGDVRYVLHARSRWSCDALDSRFAWRLSPRGDPLWNVGTGLRVREDAFLSTTSYLTAWFTRVPTACVVFDLVCFDAPALAQPRARRIERATLPLALRRAAALPCISRATRDDLVARWPGVAAKTTVTSLAASPGPIVPAGRERPYVLAVGTIEPRKNLERLVVAWSSLDAGLRDRFDLLLVGPRGWDDGGIFRAARDAGAILAGHVSDAELRGLYAGCAAFAYPALREGFGLPVAEALAAGAPVLTSSTSSLPEVAGDAALLVDPHDTGAIADGLSRLLTDDELRDRLRAAGPRQASSFSWDRCARETLSLLRAIAR